MAHALDQWLDRFPLDGGLRPHVAHVLASLPDGVLHDFLSDPSFTLFDYDPFERAGAAHVPVAAPTRNAPSRSVVLKRTLTRRPEPFIRWVIAHEFAHAHLRNGGRSPGEDPEHAADSLASDWGFPRPAR